MMRRSARWLVLLAAGCAGGPETTPVRAPELRCAWAHGEIRIDGADDEADWAQAPVIDGFGLPWLGPRARPARTATRARLLWDREYLYFHADMEDSDLFARVTERDGETWSDDVFEIFLKPAADRPGYYEFQVNAAGTLMDVFLPRRNAGGFPRFKSDTDFGYEAAVRRRGTLNDWRDNDRGWSVEGRISWKGFLDTGGRPEPGEVWTAALCRYDYSVAFEGPELSTCAPLSRVDFHRFEDYVPLRFLGPRETPRPLGVRPYGLGDRLPPVASRVVGSPDPPPPFRVEPAFPRFRRPHLIAAEPEPGSDRMLLIQQDRPYGPSRLLRLRDAADVAEAETLLELDGGVGYSIAFHPRFLESGRFFVGWNGRGVSRVLGYRLRREPPFDVVPGSATTILEWPSDGHNGAALAFGTDGLLFVTSGDGTSDSDVDVSGQDLSSLRSKVLRIDVDRTEEGRAYAVPSDNPFVGSPGIRPETWAYGLRNPWRITVDPGTGHVWVGNNGQDALEQVYLVRRGENYGWSAYEGSAPFLPSRLRGPSPWTPPALEHPHSEARSLTGGVVYRGATFPELQGTYVYGDYSTGLIWGARHDGTRASAPVRLAETSLQIAAFTLDRRGELLVVDHAGALYRLARSEAAPPSTFPRTLAASGLFERVEGHRMAPGVVPYGVNSPLWSDGAHKARFLALPPGGRIGYARKRGWEFPDGTVLVKSFALETEEGNPASQRWIETRFLTRQAGRWAGYSYRWNPPQNDASLVEAEGADAEFDVRTRNGTVEKRAWRYPSRAECMVCHSRAANFVLGLSELQMNRDFEYGGTTDNQLRAFEHAGLFRVDWASEAMEGLPAEKRRRPARPDSCLLSAPPERRPALVDPADATKPLDARVRSYLHANCSSCHVPSGGGNSRIDFELGGAAGSWFESPMHGSLDLPEARIVAPGAPERSVLFERIRRRGRGQMPPLATVRTDPTAAEVLERWIRGLK